MKPILFSFGSFHLYSFGLMVALGVTLSLFLMQRQIRFGFPSREEAYDLVFVTAFTGFLGARLNYVIQNAAWYWSHPLKIFAIWEGGLIFYGGVIGSLAGLWVFTRIRKISFVKVLDFLLPYVALTHAFGRIGCFLNGCCTGKPCNLPWAVKFPELSVPVHPTQLYEAAFDFLLFLFLSARYSKRHFDGEVTALYFMLYSVARFVIEFYRADNPFWGFLTINQWMSLLVFAAALFFYGKSKNSRG